MTIQEKIEKIINRALISVKDLFSGNESLEELAMRKIEEVTSWDGSAGQWDDAASYCSACLIDVNSAAGSTEKKKEYCKLPVKAPGSSNYADKGVMAAAGSHGIQAVKKPDGVSDDDWNAAVKKAANKIISLYNEMDKECPDKVYELAGKTPPERAIAMGAVFNALWQFADEQYAKGNDVWPDDVYFEDDGAPYAIFISKGKLFRAPITVENGNVTLGEMQEVEIIHKPRQHFDIHRQADGKYRWFNISCTSTLHKSGQIDSRELFDSFVANFDPENLPYRDFFHLGTQYRTGTIDFVARDENTLVTSGIYDDSELAQMEIKARQENPDYWGDSITFLVTADPELWSVGNGITIPVYKQGVLRAVATLPVQSADSFFIKSTMQEVNRMAMNKMQFENFVKLFGGDEKLARKWLADNTDPTNRAIEESGAITRSAEETTETVVETPVEGDSNSTTEVSEEKPISLEVTDEFVERVADVLMKRMEGKLADINTVVEALQKSTDTMRAQIEVLSALPVRLDGVEKQVNTVRQAYLDDLPAGKVVLKVTRPSTRSAEPESKTDSVPDEDETSDDVAQETLAKIAAY